MTFEEAIAWLDQHGIESISTPDARRYIWECVAASAALGPAVEIGSAYGGTTLLMVWAGASRVISVDNWQCGQREVFIRNIAAAGVSERVEMHIGRSEDLHTSFADDSLGYVMVDGWHWGDTPYNDMRNFAPKVRPGGFLLVDAIANGHPDVTRGVLRWLAEEPHFRFHHEIRRTEVCSSAHLQTVVVGFQRIGGWE